MPRATRRQPVLVKDDPTDPLHIPSFLRLTAKQRHAAWEKNPPKPVPFVPEPIERRQVLEERRKEESLAKLRKSQKKKAVPDRIAAFFQDRPDRELLSKVRYERILRELPTASMKRLLASMYRLDGKVYHPTSPALARAKLEEKPTQDERAILRQQPGHEQRAKLTKEPTQSQRVDPLKKPNPQQRKSGVDQLAAQIASFTSKGSEGLDRVKLKQLAQANEVWSDKYESLGDGLARMTVGNRIRARAKGGKEIRWPR